MIMGVTQILALSMDAVSRTVHPSFWNWSPLKTSRPIVELQMENAVSLSTDPTELSSSADRSRKQHPVMQELSICEKWRLNHSIRVLTSLPASGLGELSYPSVTVWWGEWFVSFGCASTRNGPFGI
jgi:hypothetical protein